MKFKAIILAAGEGTRLRPLTSNRPKCMVEIFGKSLLEHQIECFRKCGINDITVVTGYLGDTISFPNVNYIQNNEYQKTNMVYSLFCAEKILADAVIVSYGDIIFEKNILEKLLKIQSDLSVVIDTNWNEYWMKRFDNPIDDAESLRLDNDGYIKNIGQKVTNIDEIEGQYIGLMKFQDKGVDLIKKYYDIAKQESIKGKNLLNPNTSFEKSFMTDFLQYLINSGCKIQSIPTQNGWLELDSINDYELYNKMYKNGEISKFFKIKNETKCNSDIN